MTKDVAKRYKVHGTYIDDYSHTQALVDMVMAEDYERLRTALVGAVAVIQTWHNMGLPAKGSGSASSMWDIYWRNAPEMKQIREALLMQQEETKP